MSIPSAILAMFWLATVITPISVADIEKSGDFDLWSDLNLTSLFNEYFENLLKSNSSRAFDRRLARLPMTIGSRVRQERDKIYLFPRPQRRGVG